MEITLLAQVHQSKNQLLLVLESQQWLQQLYQELRLLQLQLWRDQKRPQ
jgi:hypothetical protein